MFALDEELLKGRILGCGDGPAAFNAQATAAGHDVTSVDPLYAYDRAAIYHRISEVFETVVDQVRRNRDEFVWGRPVRDLAHLRELRSTAMRRFLDDYPAGVAQGRYLAGALPSLDQPDRSFDLALCSHYLFLYSEHVSLAEHLASLRELCRVAAEVRVFPIQELGSRPSRHLAAVLQELRAVGHRAELRSVDYEFQRGGDQMLVIGSG